MSGEATGQLACSTIQKPSRIIMSQPGLASRYDAFVHIDRTKAVKPLDMAAAKQDSVPKWEAELYPEGY